MIKLVGLIELSLEFLQQVEDLRLNRHIQGGDEFVGHDQTRSQRQGASYTQTLALPTAEVFPQPLSPTGARHSPACRSKLIPSTARTWPTGLLGKPRVIGKCLTRPLTSRSGD